MRQGLIHLDSQLVIVGVGILTVLFIAYESEWPLSDGVLARVYGLPRLEADWGFRFGTIPVQGDGVEHLGIVGLTPDGRLAQLGVRLHDIPVDVHLAHGAPASLVLYHALLASERGERTAFDVVNLDDYAAGRGAGARRTIAVPSRR